MGRAESGDTRTLLNGYFVVILQRAAEKRFSSRTIKCEASASVVERMHRAARYIKTNSNSQNLSVHDSTRIAVRSTVPSLDGRQSMAFSLATNRRRR